MKTCSQCRVAKYCSQDCQRKDWSTKSGGHQHREFCKVLLWNENRAVDAGGFKGVMPLCLASVGLIEEDNFILTMSHRQELLMDELQRCTEASNGSLKHVHLADLGRQHTRKDTPRDS